MLQRSQNDSGRLAVKYRPASEHIPRKNWHYAVKSLLLRRETSLLYGPSNVGKSAFVTELGYHVVHGAEIDGRRTKRGLVVHVAAEAPECALDRAAAYALDGGTCSALERYLVWYEAVDLGSDASVRAFCNDVSTLSEHYNEPVMLVMFDTLVLSIGDLEENDSGDMKCVVESVKRIAKQLDAHVMLVHHTGKDGDRGSRGSSTLNSNVDTDLTIKRDQESDIVTVTQLQQRQMTRGASICFQLHPVDLGVDDEGDPRTTVRAHIVDGTSYDVSASAPSGAAGRSSQRSRSSEREIALRTVLAGLARDPEGVGAIVQTDALIARMPAHVMKTTASRDSQRKAINRCLDNLARCEEPLVEKAGKGWRLLEAAADRE